jgi:hypothetical protein
MNLKGFKAGNKTKIASFLIIWLIVASFVVVFIPLSAPKVKGQILHLHSADLEDQVGMPYDVGPRGDGEVIWDVNEDHIISLDYTIEKWMILNIPPLNYITDPETACEINISGPYKIDVFGKLITNADFGWTRTAFIGTGHNPFDGIYFHPDSEGRIIDSLIKHSINGVVFMPGSKLISPGVDYSDFDDNMISSLQMDGVLGHTNVNRANFDARGIPTSTSLKVSNGSLNISLTNFWSHGPNNPCLYISNADVIVNPGWFRSYFIPGNCVYIDGNSNGTILSNCIFTMGNSTEDDNYYVRCEGSSILIKSSTFRLSQYGARSVIATEDDFGNPAHVVILHPTQNDFPGFWDDSFDNSTINATGDSSITLQWYMNVTVTNPYNNPIGNAPVWVEDHFGNPAEPACIITDAGGWAPRFVVTELIQYESSSLNFNPFNVSALNNSMMGYANPEPSMNMSKVVKVIVPINPVPNPPPVVSFIQTPTGVQSGPISIQFILEDPNPSDDGNLSITVEFWDPIGGAWIPASTHPTSDPTIFLNNDTLYMFVWDSRDIKNFPDKYSTNVKIRITPSDRGGSGTPSETGDFTVDNKGPEFLSDPVVTPSDTTALIEWTVDETATASVIHGLDDSLTHETTGTTGSTLQSVILTNLVPGRCYSFIIKSTDIYGNTNSSLPVKYRFETEIHIQLYEGWNMISLAPFIMDTSIETALESIAGKYDEVQWYDANDPEDPWKHYVPSKPFGNDLTDIMSEMGIWIHMTEDAILIHDNIVPPKDIPPAVIPLLEGWNFVGYPSVTTRAVDDALVNITYDLVQTYDAASGNWLSWDGSYGNLVNMELSRGYWIRVPYEQVLGIPYI